MAYQSINPYNGSILATFDEHRGAALETRLHAAERRQEFTAGEAVAPTFRR